MEELIPLGAEDRAILDLECRTIAGHTCKIVRLAPDDGPAFDVARLRARVAERIELAPALTRRLGGSAHSPAWVPDEDFDISAHVVAAPVDGPVDRPALLALIARLFEQRLDRSRPLWRIDTVAVRRRQRADLAHPSLARRRHGLGPLCPRAAVGRRCRGEHDPGAGARRARRRRGAPPRAPGRLPAPRVRARRVPLAVRRHDRHAPRGRLRRRPAGALHEAAKTLDGATVNDAILTIVAGAVGRWVRQRHGDLGTIRVRVPVSLHHEGDEVANHDSFFSVGLPLNEPDPVARLRATHAATNERKLDRDAQYREHLLHELSGVPPLEHFVTRMERNPRRFALSVSNVPGPREPVSVLGASVAHLHSIAEIGERHALRVSATSLAGLLCFGLCTDPDLVDELQLMAEGIEAEAQELFAAAGVA